jgi:signal peptidase I
MSKSLHEKEVTPTTEAYNKGLMRVFRYSGLSMQSTFRTGQLLYVRPGVQDVKPGDVVVYEQAGRYFVHRVLSIGENGYITRGDNNQFTDPEPVASGQVIGRVEIHQSQSGSTWVRGGRAGLWLVHLRTAARWLEPSLRLVFGWPYRLLKASKIVPRIWRPVISHVHLNTDSSTLVKYIYHKKTVAIWEASRGRFECRQPFDLIISHPEE